MDGHSELRQVLQTDESQRHDLVISPSVLISCIAIDEQEHSWVLPYITFTPSRFMDSRFELCFSNVVVAVTVSDADQEPLERILQAVAEWRLSLIAHGERFKIQVRVLSD